MSGRRSSGSAHLGSTLRSVLVSPGEGFGAAVGSADRRARVKSASGAARKRRSEGRWPYVLAALGGVCLMMLWLKLGGLVGGREVAPGAFGYGEVVAAFVAGAVLALLGQAVFGIAGRLVVKAVGGSTSARDLRIVWGAAAFPQVFALAFLLPLDLIIVGPEIFSTTRLADSVATGWAALSIAVAVALALWSVGLFAKGLQVVAGLTLSKATAGVLTAASCFALVVIAGSLLLLGVWG